MGRRNQIRGHKARRLSTRLRSVAGREPLPSSRPSTRSTGAQTLARQSFDLVSWIGLAAPAGTPSAIVQQLNAEINAILQLPDVKERFADLGAVVVGGSTATFDAFIRKEVQTWTELVKAAGIQAD